jgi:PhzF family phenazine biosynthesis protein
MNTNTDRPSSTPLYQVDAFTTHPFSGNPAAVCILQTPADAEWMQNVAREMNLSETAFLVSRTDGDGFDLRWFTPAAEVDLCGHATLASAHILWESGILPQEQPARFHTRSGLLTCRIEGDWPEPKWISMDFPAKPEKPVTPPEGLVHALGITPSYVGANVFDYIVEVPSEEIVRNIKPDFVLLKELTVRGVMVTSRSTSSEYDFVSRFFAPAVGINEDPVTGSAHCCLAPYWGKKLGKDAMIAYQASARGGVVKVQLLGDRVILSGQAVTILRGELK